MDALDTPITGQSAVAARFRISVSTLKRWRTGRLYPELALSKFVFNVGGKVATTERLACQFFDHARSISQTEVVHDAVAKAFLPRPVEPRKDRGGRAGSRPAPVPGGAE